MHQRYSYVGISIDEQFLHLELGLFILIDLITDQLQKELSIILGCELRQPFHILLSSLLHIGGNVKLIILRHL